MRNENFFFFNTKKVRRREHADVRIGGGRNLRYLVPGHRGRTLWQHGTHSKYNFDEFTACKESLIVDSGMCKLQGVANPKTDTESIEGIQINPATAI